MHERRWVRRRSDSELTPGEGEFAARVAPAIRAVEPLPVGFEERVMNEVRAASSRDAAGWRAPTWWARRREFKLSFAEGFALAAAFVVMVAFGMVGVGGAGTATVPVAASAAASDTVFMVRFALSAPGAAKVTLVGGFNGWSREATVLRATGGDGIWRVTVPLPAGRHEYAFLVDGERWVVDPFATRVADEFGVESSVLRLGSGG